MGSNPQCSGQVRVFKNGVSADSLASRLSARVRYLLEDPYRALEMSRAGRAFTREAYANHRIENELENLYIRLLKQKNIRRPGINRCASSVKQ